jgi:hypothetical protein
MVGRLKLNERAYPIIAQMDIRFEVLGVGIDLEVSGQPAEVRSVFRRILAIQQPDKWWKLRGLSETHAPQNKRLIHAVHGNLYATPDEEVLTIDDACIRCQFTMGRPFSCGNDVVIEGS